MPFGLKASPVLLLVSCSSILFCDVDAAPSKANTERDSNNPLNIDWGPAPAPEDGPPASAGALRDPAYLPAQIGGIVGSYALALVLVAITLLALSKRRRELLRADEQELDEDDDEYEVPTFSFPDGKSEANFPYPLQTPKGHVRNFSYPSPTSPTSPARSGTGPYILPPRSSTTQAPGINLSVDQGIVAADRQMAQQQLEEMYRHVMEQEAAKEAGIILPAPQVASPQQQQQQWVPPNSSTSTLTKKEKHKPTSLNLNKEEKTQSRASSILSALRSPRKKKVQGISISSPIMTPMSGTFPPNSGGQEMNAIPPRHYAPPPPPPVPTKDQAALGGQRRPVVAPLTPDMSPQSTQSIDERIGSQIANPQGHSRNMSAATAEADPVSAASERSTTPLIGLPSSPKPGDRFPSLPSSPKPGSSFSRPNAPTAVRTGGSLPLRAYAPSIVSPTTGAPRTKQTVFERGPMSPGLGTPYTGASVPYSPYQPFSPVVPITPSLVTKADRKRMKKMEPKTPTLQMVKSDDEMW